MAVRGPAAPITIVLPDTILDAAAIENENWTLMKLRFESPIDAMRWLARRRLLKNSRMCETCRIPLSFLKRNDINDKWRWQCRICKSSASIRKGSFFERSHLSLQQLIAIIYCWSLDYPQNMIAHEAELGEHSTHTIVDWASFCRSVCQQDAIDHPILIGGLDENNLSRVVEIDETKFYTRKYDRGLYREGHWVFGGIERGSGRCFVVQVQDRTQATLLPIIERYILPGTIVVSDGWRAYENIDQLGGGMYEHQVVVHEENFVAPEDPALHTQNVENMWIRAKRKLRRQFGTYPDLFTAHLDEFVWRNRHKGQFTFTAFLNCIAEQYP